MLIALLIVLVAVIVIGAIVGVMLDERDRQAHPDWRERWSEHKW